MANGTLAAGDGAPRLIDALHRIYLASLSQEELDTIEERIPARVRNLELAPALDMLAESDVDHLQRWHLVASVVHRQPTLVDIPHVKASLGRAVIGKPVDDGEIDNSVVEQRLAEFAAPRKPKRPDRNVDPERSAE